MNKPKILVLNLLLSTLLFQQSIAGIPNCIINTFFSIKLNKPLDIKEDEWIVWNKDHSDAEIARYREDRAGTWGFARIKEGVHSLHSHEADEWYFIREGTGIIRLGNKIFKVKPGDKIFIPGNEKHSLRKHPDSKEDLIFEYFFPKVKDFENTVEYRWLYRTRSH